MQPVQSTNISEVGYEAETQTLRVRFKGGSVYEYHGVPPDVHAGLLEARSKGAYLAKMVVRNHRYGFRKLSLEEAQAVPACQETTT